MTEELNKQTEAKEQEQIEREYYPEQFRIGDIFIQSHYITAEGLANLSISLLENKTIKDYLKIIEIQKKINGASYVD